MSASDGGPPIPSGSAGGATGRGPNWQRAPGEATPPPPTAFSAATPGLFVGDTGAHGARSGSSEELFTARYNRNGITPIPFGLVAIASMLAAGWAYTQARFEVGAPDPVRSSEWWINIASVLLPGEDVPLVAYSSTRMWTAIALLLLAAATTTLWIGRIGANLRMGDAPFGAFLPLVALPAYWLLPLTIGLADGATRSRGDALIRTLVALAILIAQFVLLRWPTLNRIWRAGHLPYDQLSIALWLPMMIPWAMWLASTSWTLMTVDEDAPLSDSSWLPTSTMLDWARWLSHGTWLAIVVLLVVVSIAQHVGMARDRANDDSARRR